jgi:hypothetical protein
MLFLYLIFYFRFFIFWFARTLSIYTTWHRYVTFVIKMRWHFIRGQSVQANLPLWIVQVLLPPLRYSLDGHIVNISSSHLLRLDTVIRDTDHKIGT